LRSSASSVARVPTLRPDSLLRGADATCAGAWALTVGDPALNAMKTHNVAARATA
jgi:hypothetical protein